MIEMDDAIRIVLENTRTIDTTRVGLGEVLGRVLAEEVRSDIDMPPFDKAPHGWVRASGRGYRIGVSNDAGHSM